MMTGQLPFKFLSFFSKKPAFGMAVFTVLSLFTFHSSFAQQWNILGNESQISSVAASYTSIAVLDSVPYVVYKEGTAGAKVKRRNSGTGAWEQVGDNIGTNVTYSRIYLDKSNNFYVTYVDASTAGGSKLAVEKYDPATNTWEPLDNNSSNLYVSTGSVNGMSGVTQYSSTPRSSLAFDSDNNPYIAFSEGSTLVPYVKKFDGTSWVTVGTGSVVSSIRAVAVSLVIDEVDVPWLAFCNVGTTSTGTTGTMALYRFGSGTWTAAATTGIPTAGIRHTSMALNSAGNLAIAYFNTGNSNRANVVIYNKTAGTWGTASSLSARDAPNLSLVSDISGNLYCSFIDAYTTAFISVARVFKQSAGATLWTELKDPSRNIDSSAGNLTIAAGSDTSKPFIVYTKTNSSSVTTPIVRMYTPPPPPAVLTSNEPSNIIYTSAVAGGNITSDGGSAITQRGVVYGTSPNPTIANTKVVAATGGTGSFSVTLTSLAPSTYYYVRAYAINGGGVPTYGNPVNLFSPAAPDAVVTTPRQMEFLTRGVVAVRKTTSSVFVSWRMLGTDSAGIAFNVYRNGVKLNATPITTSTNFLDNTTTNGTYTVRAIINGVEGAASAPVSVWANNQLTIPLQIPAGGTTPDNVAYTYSANDASVGDMDGDGEYEIVLKWDPSKVNDNAGGYSGNQIFDCYKMDGTRLWRIDLGINVNAGPHYNQFMVYDFDGDGKAEVIMKTADGTKDGLGNVIGNATVDYRNAAGWVQQGPEFLTVFNGLTGAAMATVNYEPARGAISDWGDTYGNRADRFVNAVAYLDGARPSFIAGRGYYEKLTRAAYNWRNGQLTLLWKFDSEDPANPGNIAFSSMGNHQMTVGDVDGDGKDEIINGSSAINDNGKGLWTTGKGHGDALHMTDMDLDRPGQEIWINLESPSQYTPYGLRQYDAKTGATNWGIATTGDVGRSMAADIDPSRRGYEMWGSSGNLYDVKGNQISTNKPTYNFGIWWDGDLGRELLDGTKIDRWNYVTNSLNRVFTVYQAAPISSNNSTKANPCLQADLFGDWREEVMYRYSDNTALVIFTTNTPTDYRIRTLMHDPQYRTAVAWQNSAYNQPPYPSFYIGYDMPAPPTPNIEVKYLLAPEVTGITKSTGPASCDTVVNYTAEATGYPAPAYTYTFIGATTASGVGTGSGHVFNKGITHVAIAAANSFDTVNYSFDITVVDTIKPAITAPSNLTIGTNDGCTATNVALGAPTVTDNCSNATNLTVTNNAPTSYPIGTTTITWTVTDEADNTQTATQTVTVTDTVHPTITAPANVSVNAANDSCAASSVTLGTAVTSDNCGVQSVTNDAPASFPVGTTVVTWTVTDIHSNTSTATQTVTVIDAQNPTITAPANISVNAAAGQCAATSVTLGTPQTSDNCGVASVTNNAPASFPVGVTTITWTVTDIHENTATAIQTVTVVDNQNPTITAPANVSVNAAIGSCAASGITLGNAVTADNCGVASVTNNAPTSYPVGVTTVTWTVTDVHGNTNTATQTVTVVDAQNPTITAPANISVNAATGSCNANVSLGTPVTADNCGVQSVSNNALASFPVGTTTVTWTVTDIHGNTSTATQTVTVTDTQKPVVTAPSNQFLCYNGNSYTVPALSATDNCGIATVAYTITGATSRSGTGPNASGNFSVGLSTITWTITDIHNNQTTATTTVTVNAALTVSIPDVYAVSQTVDVKNTLYVGYGPTSLTISATPAGGTAPYTYYWNTTKTTSAINVSTAGTYTVSVTDAKGCTVSASIVISVVDVTCGNNNDKVMICHNGATICVASSAVQSHLNHGDNLGSCINATSATGISTSTSDSLRPGETTSNAATVSVKAYPNPTSGRFTVQLTNYKSSKATVMIVGVNGLIVSQKEVQLVAGRATLSFDMANPAQGVYLIRVLSADGAKTEKIIVQQ